MSKLIMVLPATFWQIPIVNKIKKMGHKTLLVNLYEDSPAFKIADYHEVADILDKERCLEIAKKYNVDAIISEECDIAMPTIAYVAEKMGLPSLGIRCAALYTNKFLMREFSSQLNLPYVDYKLCKTPKDVEVFFDELRCNIIIKPLDSNSSHGVFKITAKEQIHEKFDETISFSKVEKVVLAERYIEGTEFTIDGLKTTEGHVTLAISEKRHYKHNINIANELFFSHYNDRFDYDELRRVNDAFVNYSKLPYGTLTHAEYKYKDGKYYLIEIGARGGGNLISAVIVPLMSGVDNYAYLVNSALGFKPDPVSISKDCRDRCCVLYFFDTPGTGGKVVKIEGEDFLNENAYIIDHAFNFKVGDTIQKAVSDSARIGYYIAYEETCEGLRKLMDEINNRVKIIYEE
nr:ATP-grasp domain-containing protein [Bacteroides intestinalis]